MENGLELHHLAQARIDYIMIIAVVDCGQLSLANGEVSYSFNTEYNSVATYSCNDSYWHKDKD